MVRDHARDAVEATVTVASDPDVAVVVRHVVDQPLDRVVRVAALVHIILAALFVNVRRHVAELALGAEAPAHVLQQEHHRCRKLTTEGHPQIGYTDTIADLEGQALASRPPARAAVSWHWRWYTTHLVYENPALFRVCLEPARRRGVRVDAVGCHGVRRAFHQHWHRRWRTAVGSLQAGAHPDATGPVVSECGRWRRKASR